MICPNCARDIPDDAIMCPYCGYNLRAPSTQKRPLVSIPRVNYHGIYPRGGSILGGFIATFFGLFFLFFIMMAFPMLVQPPGYTPPGLFPMPIIGPYIEFFGYKISYLAIPFLAFGIFFVIIGIASFIYGLRNR